MPVFRKRKNASKTTGSTSQLALSWAELDISLRITAFITIKRLRIVILKRDLSVYQQVLSG